MRKSSRIILFLFFLCALMPSVIADEKYFQMVNQYRNFVSISPEQPFFPLVMLFALLSGIMTFFKPKFGLILILIFMLISTDLPVSKKGEVERAVTIRIEDVLLLMVTGGWLLNRAKTRTLSIMKNVPVNRAVIVMSMAIILSGIIGIFQETVETRRAILFGLKRLEYFWLYFMTLNILDGRDDVWRALKFLMICSAFIAIFSIGQFFIAPSSPLVGGGTTATVGFGRANSLASFYLLVSGIVMGMLLCSREPLKLCWYWIMLGITIIALLFTKSRGAYVSFVPMMLVTVLISRNKKVLLLFLLMLVIYGLYSVMMLFSYDPSVGSLIKRHSADFEHQFSSIKDVAMEGPEADSSLYARYSACKYLFPEIMNYPIFGHGVGAMRLGHIDVQYFHELYDTGFVGLFALLYLNIVVLFYSFKLYWLASEEMDKGLGLGFFIGLIGVLVHGLTITNFYTILNMEAYCFVLGLVMILYYEKRKELMEESIELERVEKLRLEHNVSVVK